MIQKKITIPIRNPEISPPINAQLKQIVIFAGVFPKTTTTRVK